MSNQLQFELENDTNATATPNAEEDENSKHTGTDGELMRHVKSVGS